MLQIQRRFGAIYVNSWYLQASFVWHHISLDSHLMLALSVAIPASSLCINRHLYHYAIGHDQDNSWERSWNHGRPSHRSWDPSLRDRPGYVRSCYLCTDTQPNYCSGYVVQGLVSISSRTSVASRRFTTHLSLIPWCTVCRWPLDCCLQFIAVSTG